MSFSFKPLWKLLIERSMKKDDLRILLKTSPATIAKMGKDEYVSMKILDDICNELNCEINDVVQHIKEKGD